MGALPLDLLVSPPLLGLLGLCVGSFLNVVVHRMPLVMERQWRYPLARVMLPVAIST